MAQITKQFLTSKYRRRDYEMEEVKLVPWMMQKESEISLWIELEAGYGRRQSLALSRKDVQALAVELLRSLDSDREVHRVLDQYFREGRRKRPVTVDWGGD